VEILEALADEDRLSPVQFCSNGEEISRVAYHFRALKRAGLLEPAGSEQRRGATEHFYRLSLDARD
jgi:DNA-binding transcriptional ArsR family regulator